MKRILPLVALIALAVASFSAPRPTPDAPRPNLPANATASSEPRRDDRADASARSPSRGARNKASSPTIVPRADTPERSERHAALEARDTRADANRRALYAANIAQVEAAIARAEGEGLAPAYVAALRQRRSLLVTAVAEEAANDG